MKLSKYSFPQKQRYNAIDIRIDAEPNTNVQEVLKQLLNISVITP
jgi:hypothetical protein